MDTSVARNALGLEGGSLGLQYPPDFEDPAVAAGREISALRGTAILQGRQGVFVVT